MKKLMLHTALVCMVIAPLAACGGHIPLVDGTSVSQQAPEISLQAEKSLVVAHLAYNELGRDLIRAAQNGVLHGTAADTAKKYYDKAGDALLVADRANKLSNETNLLAAIRTANDAIFQAKNLIGGQ